ncbi:putative Acid phosphatase [Helianthus annuus]|nr:putative Acid phosphatase [Helianthus annuus]
MNRHIVYLFLGLVLGALRSSNGGISSRYSRSNDISADMPLNSDVFAVPPGYNAPQQVDHILSVSMCSKLHVCVYLSMRVFGSAYYCLFDFFLKLKSVWMKTIL